jgi:hypothetical protein
MEYHIAKMMNGTKAHKLSWLNLISIMLNERRTSKTIHGVLFMKIPTTND